MKKSSIIKICSAVIVFAVIMVGIISLQAHSASIPDFEFLKHSKPFFNAEGQTNTLETKTTNYYYAFATDYNDFSVKAFEELKKFNFRPDGSLIFSIPEDSINDKPGSFGSEWYSNDSSKKNICVSIFYHSKLSEEGKRLQELNKGSMYNEDFVTVRISCSEKQNRLAYKLKMFLYQLGIQDRLEEFFR